MPSALPDLITAITQSPNQKNSKITAEVLQVRRTFPSRISSNRLLIMIEWKFIDND